jgi:hypothetical protein
MVISTKLLASIVGVLVAVVAFLGGMSHEGNVSVSVLPNQTFGAAGNDFGSRIFAREGITAGGSVLATTSAVATYTLVASEFVKTPQVINWLPNLNTTLSISSTSTLPYIPNVGDTAEVYFRNASTTLAATITFAAKDAGVDIQIAEATGGDLVLNGTDWAKVTLIRTTQNLVTVIFDEMIHGD